MNERDKITTISFHCLRSLLLFIFNYDYSCYIVYEFTVAAVFILLRFLI